MGSIGNRYRLPLGSFRHGGNWVRFVGPCHERGASTSSPLGAMRVVKEPEARCPPDHRNYRGPRRLRPENLRDSRNRTRNGFLAQLTFGEHTPRVAFPRLERAKMCRPRRSAPSSGKPSLQDAGASQTAFPRRPSERARPATAADRLWLASVRPARTADGWMGTGLREASYRQKALGSHVVASAGMSVPCRLGRVRDRDRDPVDHWPIRSTGDPGVNCSRDAILIQRPDKRPGNRGYRRVGQRSATHHKGLRIGGLRCADPPYSPVLSSRVSGRCLD